MNGWQQLHYFLVNNMQTYVNNRPLRGSSVRLQHNDTIRFGYGELTISSC